MGSSLASSTDQQFWNYDVFLSFRGPDTGKNFIGHLYAALYQRGILTFLNTETLPHGLLIDATLLKAIKESRIAVVVFSKTFVNSLFCLNELEYIIRCRDEMGKTVVPIYYHVDPLDVQKQEGAFNMDEWNWKVDKNKAVSWRNALVEAGNLSGWTVGYNHDIREALCIKQVVDTISNKLFPNKVEIDMGTLLQDTKLCGGTDDSVYDHSKQTNTSVPSSVLYSHPSNLTKFDVFLSFQGEDTRYNFVEYLYLSLNEHGIHTYMDQTLVLCDPAYQAIEESRISVIIFSKNYASSSLCMDQLLHIMKCKDERGQIVIPIFYDVYPRVVGSQRGDYEEAFSKHESMNPNKAELWRKALKDANNINGWMISQIANGNEAKGIQVIVKKISNILFPDKDLIGLQTRLGDMKYRGDGMMAIPSSSYEDLKHLRITLDEILLATDNFSKNKIIAAGGFGKVYIGQSVQHGTIAVKQLERRLGGQGDHEFMMEIALLSAYKHENLVSLVGYCDQDGEKIIVLKYETNGSLDKHLHSKDLNWIQRLQICLEVAKGLKYLHDGVGTQHRILHRDIKSYNILLDENWKAKISDFGLSKIALANVPCSIIISNTCGTLGYIDPQYRDHNILSQKSDVYSFGVVLFEVLCSRLVYFRQYQDEFIFSAELAQKKYEKETLHEIIDSDLRIQINSDSFRTYSSLAYQCLNKDGEERPKMGWVVDQLEKALDYQQGLSGSLHDVYISFRHRDTECHIVDDIRIALQQGDVSTYKNEVTLSRNESMLLKAIERSRLFVIIFTKKFALNSWYLDEVAKILECMKEKRQFLLPVFLNVSRSDVRSQKGYFGEVMSEYDTHPRMEVWRNALVEATNAPGLEYSKFRSSADLVTKVVEEIKIGLSAQVN